MTTASMRLPAALAAGALLLGACSDEGGTEVTAEEIARVEQTLAQGSELHWELTQTEARVAAACMEDFGFTVHDPLALHGNTIPHRFNGFHAPYERIPTIEQAAKFGFGQWMFHGLDPEQVEAVQQDPDYIAYTAADAGWDDDGLEAHDRWMAMGEEYHREWRTAFLGQAGAEYQEAMNAASDEDFEEGDLPEKPPFGGCELTTLEVVYGGPAEHEGDDGDVWYARPNLESPLTWVADGAMYTELSADFRDQETDFLDCVDERGYGQWEFDEFGWLPTYDYFSLVYVGEPTSYPQPENLPEPPSDLPDEREALKQFELDMAMDFAECADTAGLREDADEAWARLHVEQLIDREAEIFAWEDQIDEYLTNAQEYLGA
ncbi:hypothetical protein [Glycomyces tarimensis]